MHILKQAVLIISMLFLLTSISLSQERDEARGILKKVAETYRNLKSYYFESNIVVKVKRGQTQVKMDSSIVLAAVKPDKMRMEIKKSPMMLDWVVISNGSTTWEFIPTRNEYTKKPGGLTTITAKGIDGVERTSDKDEYLRVMAVALGVLLPRYDNVMDGLKQARNLRDESLDLNRTNIDCYVIEAQYDTPEAFPGAISSAKVFWIDKKRYVVVREEYTAKIDSSMGAQEHVHTNILTVVKLDELLPETLFTFTPPEGATEVEDFTSQKKKKKAEH
jgi:outer membrane lipoprotein-sorting protein